MQTEQTNPQLATSKDYRLGILAGALIGILLIPILKTAIKDLPTYLYVSVIPFFIVGAPLGLKVASIIGKKIFIVWQVAKFGLIGVMNTLVDLGVLAFLQAFFMKYFEISPDKVIFSTNENLEKALLIITVYSIYKAVSFIIANINSYFWNKHWTFKKENTEKSPAEFFQFFVVSTIGFFINVIVASYIFTSIASMAGMDKDQWGLIGAAAGSIAGLVWNFIGYKFWVFKK